MGCSFSDTTKRKEALQCKYNIIYIASNKKQRDLEEAVKIATQKQIFEDDFLGMEVELSIACQNLPNYDTLSLTDAACAIYLQQKKYLQYIYIYIYIYIYYIVECGRELGRRSALLIP